MDSKSLAYSRLDREMTSTAMSDRHWLGMAGAPAVSTFRPNPASSRNQDEMAETSRWRVGLGRQISNVRPQPGAKSDRRLGS